MTPSRLAALCACFLVTTVAGCSTSGLSATDLLTRAPVPADQPVPGGENRVAAAEEPAADAPLSLASVATDVAAMAGDAAKAAADAVTSVADAPKPAPETPSAAAPEPAAKAYVDVTPSQRADVTPSQPVVEVAYAPAHGQLPDQRTKLDRLISHYADVYDVPKDLIHRVVRRESNYRPTAFNGGNWGLMQIRHSTALGMGYDGKAEGLLDAETNLRYAVRYLRGAYMVAGGDKEQAIRLYSRGYYYDAKRAGLLDETGLGRDRVRGRPPG
jgi:soluble lytic murein transglycosylase-like protein